MKTVYCTIASANYLPQVMALVDSLKAHRPGADVRILLCEHPSIVRELSAELGLELVAPDQIGCESWLHMAFYYDVMEFNTAVKPYFVRTLFQQGADAVVYFDPDIVVFQDTKPIEDLLETHQCVLTPHNHEPLPDDGLTPRMVDVNRTGQFNLGFGAFRNTPVVERVMKWWEDRLRVDCISDLKDGLFVDQSWANLFASFIPDCYALRSRAYNLAYWNYPQRKLWRQDGAWMTEDGPLVFFHYSGFMKDDLERVSRHQNRVRAPAGTPLREILTEYRDLLAKSPYAALTAFKYSFGAFHDGAPIPMSLRRRFRSLAAVERALSPNPFGSRGWLESMRDVGHDPIGEVERLRHEVAFLREQLGLPRYRMADKLNDALKKVGVQQTAKALVQGSGSAARRLAGIVRRGS